MALISAATQYPLEAGTDKETIRSKLEIKRRQKWTLS
jgi:hypothetical protein